MSGQQFDPITGQPITPQDATNSAPNTTIPGAQPFNIPGAQPINIPGAQPVGNAGAKPVNPVPVQPVTNPNPTPVQPAQPVFTNPNVGATPVQPVIPGAQPNAGATPVQPVIPGAQQAANAGQPVVPGMTTIASYSGTYSPKNPADKKKLMIIGGGIAAALILIVAIIAFSSGADKKPNDPIDIASSKSSKEDTKTPDGKKSDDPSEDKSSDADKKPAANTPANVDSSSMFAFTVDGETYSLPLPVSYFLDHGWTFQDGADASELIGTNETTFTSLNYKGKDTYCSVAITNYSFNAYEAKDCYVTEISLYSRSLEKSGIEASIQNGQIIIGKSKSEDVTAIFGNPDHEYSGTLTYYKDHDDMNVFNTITFTFDDSTGVLQNLTITNEEMPEGFDRGEVNEATPDYVSQYKDPSSLGDDFLSGNFQLGGKVYNLPVPLQKLLDDGWSIASSNVAGDSPIGAEEQISIALSKDDQSIYVMLYNKGNSATLVKNSMITELSVYISSYRESDFEVPGLSTKTSNTDFKAMLDSKGIKYEYKDEYEYYKISLDQDAENSDYYNGYRIYVNSKEDSMDSITLSRKGWLAD
ncbi:hypothetical protein SAMN02745247_01075 [Butyrivibrio hungatei DSM 14810]|uniref:Uncharacterized protein n=1 Tax=Butyrivibrio hungatei DSM 14810 TaxID=1121132 RepID=A0A1M7S4X2_9FIRM|nr:hypothetical protein [Butyrivibrio hungatei]SHN53739.1 hypothetical protein SAMN02745247_01075 [Butyrivibrio hungatei DSM 14810]